MVGERRRVHVLRGEERVVQEDCCVISTGNQTGYNPGLRANSAFVCVCVGGRGGAVWEWIRKRWISLLDLWHLYSKCVLCGLFSHLTVLENTDFSFYHHRDCSINLSWYTAWLIYDQWKLGLTLCSVLFWRGWYVNLTLDYSEND